MKDLKNWKKEFEYFYTVNQHMSSGGWMASPITVSNFIEGLLSAQKAKPIMKNWKDESREYIYSAFNLIGKASALLSFTNYRYKQCFLERHYFI